MANILNLLNQRTVALAGLSALATVAAYCVYTRKPWIKQEEKDADKRPSDYAPAGNYEVSSKCAVSTTYATASSSDSGVHVVGLADESLEHFGGQGSFASAVLARRTESMASIVDLVSVATQDSAAAARELAMVAMVICSKPEVIAQDANGNLVAKDDGVVLRDSTYSKSSESVAIDAIVVVNTQESDVVTMDANENSDAMVESVVTLYESTLPNQIICKPVAKDATDDVVNAVDNDAISDSVKSVAKDAISDSVKSVAKDACMPAVFPLTPQFVDARLRVLSNASDSATLILVDGDADILGTRLLALINSQKSSIGSQDLVACLQLIGRHLLAPQRAEIICRNGNLIDALVEAYNSPAADNVEVRVRCLLALVSVPTSCHGNSASLVAASLTTVDRLVGDLASARLRPHALRLLCQLGPACRQGLAGHTCSLLTHLGRRLNATLDAASFSQLSGLVASLFSDPASRSLALAVPVAAFAEFPRPETNLLRSDAGIRAAWLELLAAVVACAGELGAVWWAGASSASLPPRSTLTSSRSSKKAAGISSTLAGLIRVQLPDLYKQVKKLADKLKSPEKRSPQGQRLLAVKKEVKALKLLAKRKPKVKK